LKPALSSPLAQLATLLPLHPEKGRREADVPLVPLRLVALYGSVRSDRQGIRAARFIVEQCRRRGHEVALIDALEYPLPLLDRMYKEYAPGQAPDVLERMARLIIGADAYVVVTGEYNHNVPPGLANLLDHFLEEYFWKPSAIVCYSAGSFGGVRASVVLRSMLAELGMSSIPSELPVPRVQDAFDEEGRPRDGAWLARAERFLGELEWYAEALRAARVRDGKDACPARSFCEAQQAGPARK
jgi:NAD(P)H-dependent FMN reductase